MSVTVRTSIALTLPEAFDRLCADAPHVWLDSAVGDADRGQRSWLVLAWAPVVDVGSGTVAWYQSDGTVTRRPLNAATLWAELDARFRADEAVHGAEAPGWVGYATWDAASIADPAIPPRPGEQPPHAMRWGRIRAALRANAEGVELVVTEDDVHAADAALRDWKNRLDTSAPALDRTPALRRSDLRPARSQDVQRAIATIIEAIHAGRVYQACYTFPIQLPRPPSMTALYRALREANPGDFGVSMQWGPLQLASVSPERLCQAEAGRVRARPMKGTLPRRAPEVDAADRHALQQDPKSRAENVMIVDLLRNDLGRVCEPGSVHVPELFVVETYATVHQMTSTVEGRLRAGVGPFSLLQAVFPPGSMSGAPRVEACRLLNELEAAPRGLYAGSVGHLGFDGRWTFNVVIRGLQAWNQRATWWVGGGIVADSDPAAEEAEALSKAAPLFAICPA